MNIYVGNLSPEVTEEDLQQAFEAFGKVESVNVIKDKFSGVSRGFGFVEMPTKAEGQAAIEGLSGKANALDVTHDLARTPVQGRRPRMRGPTDRHVASDDGAKAAHGQPGLGTSATVAGG